MTTEEQIPQDKLNRLKKDLRGHLKKVAKRAGVDPATLHRVLNGEWVNMKVIETAINYRDEITRNNNAIIAKL